MKILITGAMGYIGTELLYRLSSQTHTQIFAVDNDIAALRDRSGFFSRSPNIRVINADITNAAQVMALPKVDLIVHLAAVVGYIQCGQTPELAMKTNVDGTALLTQLGTPMIFLSTGSVYGEIGDVCKEDVDLNPQTLYAETKVMGETLVKQIPNVILRPATAFGMSFKVRHDLLVHNLTIDAIKNKRIRLYQPDAMRSFYSVQKIAELLEYIAFNFSKFDGKTMNVGCRAGNVKKKTIAEILLTYCDFDLEIIDGKDLDTRDYHVNYDLLESHWNQLDENFDLQVEKIVRYYKTWNK